MTTPDSERPLDPRHVPLRDDSPGPEFHPWRLLGFIAAVVLSLAGASILLQILLLHRNG